MNFDSVCASDDAAGIVFTDLPHEALLGGQAVPSILSWGLVVGPCAYLSSNERVASAA